MSYKYIDHTIRISAEQKTNIPIALRFIAEDIKRTAEPNTPKEFGPLRDSTVISVTGHKAKISWKKEYAAYQERGRRKDGSHVVKKYTTPGTGPHYAENAARKVGRTAGRHFKRARIIQ